MTRKGRLNKKKVSIELIEYLHEWGIPDAMEYVVYQRLVERASENPDGTDIYETFNTLLEAIDCKGDSDTVSAVFTDGKVDINLIDFRMSDDLLSKSGAWHLDAYDAYTHNTSDEYDIGKLSIDYIKQHILKDKLNKFIDG